MWKEAIASSGVLVFVGPDKNHEAYNLVLSVSGQSSKEKPPPNTNQELVSPNLLGKNQVYSANGNLAVRYFSNII